MSQKPLKSFRAGRIQASIWRNEQVRDGQTVIQHSVRIEKRYKDKDGSYKNTDYFFDDDLPRLALLANKAFEFLTVVEKDDLPV